MYVPPKAAALVSVEKHELVEKEQEMKAIVQGTSIEYWNNIYDEFISRLD